jgi:hypothetical protein
VNISKDQIVQLLESQGNHDKAQQASQHLPDQVDTDNGQHADLLSRLGLDTGSLGNQLGGLGKILLPAGRGAASGELAGLGDVGGWQRAPVRCCRAECPPAPPPLDPATHTRL